MIIKVKGDDKDEEIVLVRVGHTSNQRRTA